MNSTTIVISNYNYASYVRAAIESAVYQQEPCDIIVVDDDSTDKSWSSILEAKSHFDSQASIKLVRLSRNSGGNARGKNVGIALCETEYVVCLDSDDALLSESVLLRKKLFEPGIDWVHGRALRMKDNRGYNHLIRRYRNSPTEKLIAQNMYKKEILRLPETDIKWYKAVEASTVMARRSCYEQVGLYDEDLKWKIDREMWYRFLTHGVKKKFTKDPVSIYRIHNRQVTRDRTRKNPAKIDRMFANIVDERKRLTEKNTLMLKNYDPHLHIKEIVE